jgi:peptidoglycan/LPS O-acetylase OafA/YrhL
MRASESRVSARRPMHALTGFRFLAAFYVVLFHFASQPASEHHLPRLIVTALRNGFMGVPFFFLLSGFVLTYSYAGDSGRPRSRWEFWVARFARVYPVYLLSLLLNWPFRGDGEFHIVLSRGALAATLLATQTWNPHFFYLAQAWNPPAWTLSVEIFFYLCFPFLLPACVRLSTRAREAAMIGLVLIIVFCHTAFPVGRLQEPLHHILLDVPLPVVRLPEFLLGILMGLEYLERKPAASNWRSAVSLAAAAAILCTLHGPWLTLSIVPFAVLIYEMAAGGGMIGRLLSTKAAVFLGGASYAIYLLQFPVRNWVRAAFQQWDPQAGSWGALLSPALLMVAACAVFQWYEEPARRLVRGCFASLKGRKQRGAVTAGEVLESAQAPAAAGDH